MPSRSPKSKNLVDQIKKLESMPYLQDSFVRRKSPTVSIVYDSFWRFAHERQEVYFGRLYGLPSPWSPDPIIQTYKFTNAYRAADRVSQFLIRHVLYPEEAAFKKEDVLFRALLFKIFNKIETWELLESSLGHITWSSYKFKAYDQVLTKAIESRRRIYSAAYIMPPCSAMSGGGRKHQGHLRLIEHLINDGLLSRLATAQSMKDAFAILRSYPMLGNFLAYQYITDLNYSELTNFTEDNFVVAGPGALDGLNKVFLDPGDLNEADLIRWVMDRQELEFEKRGLTFRSLWGRRLQLIDCQNLFCEISKYARVKHPDFTGLSGRVRIKQKFKLTGTLPIPWFPPKWKLNEAITQSVTQKVDMSNSLFT